MKILLTCWIITGFLLYDTTGDGTPAGVYQVDTRQSKVLWTGYYLFSFGEHNGSIEIREGKIQMEDQSITGGHFEIDMASIRNLDMQPGNGGNDLEEHLKSDDFFAVDKFPSARFEITKSEKIKDPAAGGPNFEVTGNLSIKGHTEVLTFPVHIVTEGKSVHAKAKFKFDRTKWNIQYNSGKFFSSVGDGAISDAIAIELDLVAVQ